MIDEVKRDCVNERANKLSTSHLRTPDHVTTNNRRTDRQVGTHAQPANTPSAWIRQKSSQIRHRQTNNIIRRTNMTRQTRKAKENASRKQTRQTESKATFRNVRKVK
jgi:hypothetical protein